MPKFAGNKLVLGVDVRLNHTISASFDDARSGVCGFPFRRRSKDLIGRRFARVGHTLGVTVDLYFNAARIGSEMFRDNRNISKATDARTLYISQ